MEPNPYQAPQQPDGLRESEGPLGADRAIQLLTEIRDTQQESLALTRDALARQRRANQMMMAVVLFLVVGFMIPMTVIIYAAIFIPPPPSTTLPTADRPAVLLADFVHGTSAMVSPCPSIPSPDLGLVEWWQSEALLEAKSGG
jgi:hypothetical protein